ncbi:MAG: hypothetical protein HC860_15345 [Alkalinema sp. RU_4_3]|nr:hypothetical protein [Alkalinema sp. RU_4_3]
MFVSIYGLASLMLLGVNAQSALAHNVKVDDQVAATFHLEPNHNPKVGEAAKIWFALAKKGGEAIALADCDCVLTVRQKEQVVATPALSSTDVEQYRGIPGATFTFPAVGLYSLRLSGKPKTGDGFNPFNLDYEVTVQAGKVSEPAPQVQAAKVSETAPTGQTENSPEESNRPVNIVPIVLGVGAIGLMGALALFLGGKRNDS